MKLWLLVLHAGTETPSKGEEKEKGEKKGREGILKSFCIWNLFYLSEWYLTMEEKWVSQLCICFPGRVVFASRSLLQQVKKKKSIHPHPKPIRKMAASPVSRQPPTKTSFGVSRWPPDVCCLLQTSERLPAWSHQSGLFALDSMGRLRLIGSWDLSFHESWCVGVSGLSRGRENKTTASRRASYPLTPQCGVWGVRANI